MILSSKKNKLNNYIFPYPGENLRIFELSQKNGICAFVKKGMEKFVYLVYKNNSKYLFVIINDNFLFLMIFK